MQICRKYLKSEQDNTFEGEIADEDFENMTYELQKLTKDQDSILVYKFRQMKFDETQYL